MNLISINKNIENSTLNCNILSVTTSLTQTLFFSFQTTNAIKVAETFFALMVIKLWLKNNWNSCRGTNNYGACLYIKTKTMFNDQSKINCIFFITFFIITITKLIWFTLKFFKRVFECFILWVIFHIRKTLFGIWLKVLIGWPKFNSKLKDTDATNSIFLEHLLYCLLYRGV